jgi:hypothetical protein
LLGLHRQQRQRDWPDALDGEAWAGMASMPATQNAAGRSTLRRISAKSSVMEGILSGCLPQRTARLQCGVEPPEDKVFLLLFFQKKKILPFLKKKSKKTFAFSVG